MSAQDRLGALSAEQRELVELLRKKRAAAKKPAGPEPIPHRGEGEEWPLTSDQERLWFLWVLDPQATAYNIDTSTRMEGDLDLSALTAALNEIVRRQEAWRTRFAEVDGRPVQIVLPEATVEPRVVDLRAVPAAEREGLARELQREEARLPFDLAMAPLVRALLVRMGDRDQICMITVHHIVTDWVTFQLFWRELAALYVVFHAGRPASEAVLPRLDIQFADFAAWQREWLSGERLERLLQFWTAELAGMPHVLELPFDRPRPPVQTTRGSERWVEVPGPVVTALRTVAREAGATPFMAVMSVFKALLFRITGQDKVVIGSPNANRNRVELEPLFGFFLTQLVFATDGSGDPTFRELLGRVRRGALAAYAHQDLPFSALLDAIRPERDSSRPPLVQANFLLLDAEYTPMDLPGLVIRPIFLDDGNSRFDTTLGLWESAERIYGFFEFNLDLFDPATVARWAEGFEAIAAAAAAEPRARLSELPLLSASALHQALYEWTGPAADLSGPTVPTLFAAAARRDPGAVAVVWGEEEITYGEIARRAARVAAGLAALGIGQAAKAGSALGSPAGREPRVGLLVERSPDVIVGMLGIWGAGAAWVPLDPAYPDERLALLAEDAELTAVVTREALRGRLREGLLARLPADGEGLPAVLLEEAPEYGRAEYRPAEDGRTEYAPAAGAADLAYVIYTSGTTGRPKGVMVEHRSLAGLLAATREAFGWRETAGAQERAIVLAPFSFDIFLFEAWNALATGGICELARVGPPLDLDRLLAGLGRATRAHAVPALMRQVVAACREAGRRGEPLAFPHLRWLFTGGDAVPPELLSDLAQVFPAARRVVLYGPTEATILATAHHDEGDHRWQRPPLGRALPGVELRLVQASGALAPLGVTGEVWLGGVGLARGYLGRAELTAQRFVARRGGRFYRTGDLARYRPDGELEFLGRADDQVKVRGFRIEPAEIEAVLEMQADVAEATVVASPAPGGGMERRLAAYFVPRSGLEGWTGPGAARRIEALREHLRHHLPEHMVPAALVPLPELPLTAHGKVDRKALPAPEAALVTLAGEGEEPRDEREAVLAEIWCAVLGLPRVGLYDNFFQLGGDSILSIQVVARARRAGLLLTPKQLFEHQTIAGLAAAAGTEGGPPLADQGRSEGEAPLTPVQRAFFAAPGEAPERFVQAVLMAAREPLERQRLRTAVARVVAHHDALRLRFLPAPAAPGGVRAVHASLDVAALEVLVSEIDLSGLGPAATEREVRAVVAAVPGAFDLAQGPIFRAVRLVGPERLFLAAHHLVVDGVSWRVLLEDLEAAYRGEELPPKSTSWQRWAEGIGRHAQSAAAGEELGYWLGLPMADLPALPWGSEKPAGAGSATVSLSPAATAALLKEAPEAYRTQINDLLLAALGRTLVAWAGLGDDARVLVELEGHGREEEAVPGADLSRTVGWFTTLFPVVVDLRGAAEPGKSLQAVKEMLRGVPRHGLGFGLLRWLGDGEAAASLAALPRPAVSFNYLGQLDGAVGHSSLLAPAPDGIGGEKGDEGGGEGDLAPRHPLEVDALVLGERFEARFTWRGGALDPARGQELAERFLAELEGLVAHCREVVARGEIGYTPADFPLAGLDQAALDRLLARSPAWEDVYALAPLQEGLLFHGLYEQGTEVYVEQLSCTLLGALDAAAFVAAFRTVVARHPALRTFFAWQDLPHPVQVVRRGVEMPWTFGDWRGEATPGERFQRFLAADRARGFDFSRPPLLRAALFRTGEREHRFAWTFHHLLFDGWCFSLLFGEVFALYAAAMEGATAGREAALAPVRPFRDYVAWLARQDREEAARAWRERLAGFSRPTPLPVDAPAAPAGTGREVTLRMDAAAAEGAAALARAEGLTLNTLAQAAWALLLARYGGGKDVVFGTVVSGRPADLPGVESIVGLFINTLPVRLTVEPRAALGPWLREVQAGQLALRQHEASPLAEVQRASEVPPGEPLFESLVVFENYPFDEGLGQGLGTNAGGLSLSDVVILDRTDLPLSAVAVPLASRGGSGLDLALGFDERTDVATGRRLLGHWAALLAGFAAGGEAAAGAGPALGEIPLLAAAERHQILTEWNDVPEAAPPGRVCLHALVEAQAARMPMAPAVLAPGEALSYAELDRRANRLARHLAARGAAPRGPVLLWVERSAEMAVAALAVLKAGAFFVPVDPAAPAERVAALVSDMAQEGAQGEEPPVLLTEVALAARLPAALAAGRRVLLDAERGAIEAQPGTPPAPGRAAGPGDLAYVIYTSGSTGVPKGVAVEHRSIAAYALSVGKVYGLGPGDRMLSFASLSFDVGVEELFCPLSHGAATVIDPGVAEEPARFLGRCRDRSITVLSMPTAYWHTLAAALGGADGAAPPLPPAVRLTILGGERALPERWAAWGRGAGAQARTLNCYGPTEATIAATALQHPGPGLGEVRREVPIGRPYPGVLAYVLDADPSGWSEPVPIGGLGELSLGGRGLARGYHHQPAATAAAFVPDPFRSSPGGWSGETRLYRTGDLVRRLADGAIEFSGRADAQVKVRGYRVEPGEVEAVLASHPAVGDAAVVAPEGPGGERRLVAFAVPRNGMEGAAFTAELADFLARRLPPYLVPSAVLTLDSLPLTAAAKVDRRALADLAASRGSEAQYVPPGNAIEEELAAIWQELLGVERVGAGDDFFALGGHSLLATRLVSRLRGHFGVEVSLPTLFERRRLADLAQEVLRLRLAKAEEGGVEDLLAELDGLSDEEALALLEREAGAAPAQETV